MRTGDIFKFLLKERLCFFCNSTVETFLSVTVLVSGPVINEKSSSCVGFMSKGSHDFAAIL